MISDVNKNDLLFGIWNVNFASKENVTKAELDKFAENIARILNTILKSK